MFGFDGSVEPPNDFFEGLWAQVEIGQGGAMGAGAVGGLGFCYVSFGLKSLSVLKTKLLSINTSR